MREGLRQLTVAEGRETAAYPLLRCEVGCNVGDMRRTEARAGSLQLPSLLSKSSEAVLGRSDDCASPVGISEESSPFSVLVPGLAGAGERASAEAAVVRALPLSPGARLSGPTDEASRQSSREHDRITACGRRSVALCGA